MNGFINLQSRIFPKIAQDILSEMGKWSVLSFFLPFSFSFTISWKLPSRLKSQNNEISKLVGLLEILRLTFSVGSSYVSNARIFHQMDDLCLKPDWMNGIKEIIMSSSRRAGGGGLFWRALHTNTSFFGLFFSSLWRLDWLAAVAKDVRRQTHTRTKRGCHFQLCTRVWSKVLSLLLSNTAQSSE